MVNSSAYHHTKYRHTGADDRNAKKRCTNTSKKRHLQRTEQTVQEKKIEYKELNKILHNIKIVYVCITLVEVNIINALPPIFSNVIAPMIPNPM